MKTKMFVLFLASAAFAFTLSWSGAASAGYRRIYGAACMMNGAAYGDIDHANNRITNTYSSGANSVVCPIIDDGSVQRSQVTYLSADIFDGVNGGVGSSVTAQACLESPYNATGYDCGSVASSGDSFTGNSFLQPQLSNWTNSNYSDWYAYVVVQLPGSSGGSSYLNGYYYSSP